MKSILLQALREEIQANAGSGIPAREIVNDAFKRVADRFEQLLDAKREHRRMLQERQAQEERNLYNEVMGDGQQ
jgi:prefoldin subunit 5